MLNKICLKQLVICGQLSAYAMHNGYFMKQNFYSLRYMIRKEIKAEAGFQFLIPQVPKDSTIGFFLSIELLLSVSKATQLLLKSKGLVAQW